MSWQPTPWWLRWKGKVRRAVDEPLFDGRHVYLVRKWLYANERSAISQTKI